MCRNLHRRKKGQATARHRAISPIAPHPGYQCPAPAARSQQIERRLQRPRHFPALADQPLPARHSGYSQNQNWNGQAVRLRQLAKHLRDAWRVSPHPYRFAKVGSRFGQSRSDSQHAYPSSATHCLQPCTTILVTNWRCVFYTSLRHLKASVEAARRDTHILPQTRKG